MDATRLCTFCPPADRVRHSYSLLMEIRVKAAAGLENTFLVRPEGPAECLIPEGHDIRVL